MSELKSRVDTWTSIAPIIIAHKASIRRQSIRFKANANKLDRLQSRNLEV